MTDIRAADFMQTFNIMESTVGVIGHGYVGKAVEAFFSQKNTPGVFPAGKVLVYDKFDPNLNTIDDVVKESQIVFVCVPTPMRPTGECYTGIVESVLQDIKDTAKRVGRPLDSFVVVVKSTVRVGFTEEMQDKHFDMRICFSPEFLTEKNSIGDFLNTNRIIVGGDLDDAQVVCAFFQGAIPARVNADLTLLLQCDPTVAEMVKLYANGILMTKILFSNEVYLMCEKLGITYEEVRALANLDRRIGASHTSVPGHDGQLGAGGHCFPKDIENLRFLAHQLGTNEKLFTSVIERNKEIREDKDWEKMVGRAIIDK